MRKRTGNFLMAIGALLLLAAAALFAYNQAQDSRAGQQAESVAAQLTAQIPETPVEKPFSDPYERTEPAMETAQVDEVAYIGVLRLPTLGLELPIAAQWDYETLRKVPCRYSGTTEGELVLCGHNYRRHFGPIDRLRPGDPVEFTDVEGNTIQYQVLTAEELAPTAVEDMTVSGYDLTLFTCTYNGQTRYTVRCVRAKPEEAS